MIIRATQKKMMSKPVTSTDDGRNVRSSRVSAGQPSVEWHHSADENHVSSTSSSRRERRGLAAELRARLRARVGFVARDVDVAGLVVPRGNPVAPPQLARDAPVLDVVDPVQVRRQPFAGHEARRVRLAGLRIARCPPSPPRRGTGPGSSCRAKADASPAPACVIATNHWSVSIGSTTSPVRPQRGTTIRCAFSETTSPAAADRRAPPCARRSGRGRDTSPARCR